MALPPGAVRNEVFKFPDYFENVQIPSADIQKEVFDKWQCKQRELFVDLSQNMAALTLHSITEISCEKRLGLMTKPITRVQDKIVAARLSKKLCADNVDYVKDQMRDLSLEMKEMNMKFHRVFGVVMKRWNGTHDHAVQLLREKEEMAKRQPPTD